MKKILLFAVVGAMMCQPCISKNIAEANKKAPQNTVAALFADFSKNKKVTHVKVGGFIMALAKVFGETMGVSGVEVFDFEECDQQLKDRLNDAIKNLKDNTYETLVSASEGGERTKILVKIKDDFISEIVIVAGGSEPALVRVTGKIKPDDIQNVVNNNKK